MQAVYFNYYGDFSKALEHFLQCAHWQKAHSIFILSVAHKLFLSGKISQIACLSDTYALHEYHYLISVQVSGISMKAINHFENFLFDAHSLSCKNN